MTIKNKTFGKVQTAGFAKSKKEEKMKNKKEQIEGMIGAGVFGLIIALIFMLA